MKSMLAMFLSMLMVSLANGGIGIGTTGGIKNAVNKLDGKVEDNKKQALDTLAPTVPTNLTATAAGSRQINLSWTASTDNGGVTNYKIYRDGSITPVATPTGTTYSDTGRTPSTTYSYTVCACDAAGNCSAPSASASATTPAADIIAPTVPTNLTATPVSYNQINLSWTASTDNVGVTSYRVYRNAGATPVATPTGTTYNDTGRTASTAYSYTVSACDADGNCSAQSASVSTTTPRQPGTYSVFSDNMDTFPTGWTLNNVGGVTPANQWKLWTCGGCTDGHTAFAGENHTVPNTYDRSAERDISLAGYSSASLSFDSTFCLSGVSLRVEEFVGGAWSPILTLANECWGVDSWRPRYTVAVSATATKIRFRLLGVATDNGQAFVDNVALAGTVN